MNRLLLVACLSLGGCATADERSQRAVTNLERQATLLEEQADAMMEANKNCTEPSHMEQIEGTEGRSASDWRCRPIKPQGL